MPREENDRDCRALEEALPMTESRHTHEGGDDLVRVLREYMEEGRQASARVLENTGEITQLRGEMHTFREGLTELRTDLKTAITDLTAAIRGGPGQKGVFSLLDVMETRLTRVEVMAAEFSRTGTPASHTTLELVRQKQEDGFRRVEALERAQREAPKRVYQVINTAVAIGAAAVALLSLILLRR